MLRDPNHVKVVLQACKPSHSISLHEELSRTLFGKRYAGNADAKQWKETLCRVHSALPKKHLTAEPLMLLTNTYTSILSANLNNKMFQVGTWTLIEDFLSFFQQVVTRCILETLLGSAIFKQYYSLVKDFQKLADSVHDFMAGMPTYLVSTANKKSCDRPLGGIERWLDANHGEMDFAKASDEQTVWDENKGSRFIQERDSIFAQIERVDVKARAADVLCLMLGYVSVSRSPPILL